MRGGLRAGSGRKPKSYAELESDRSAQDDATCPPAETRVSDGGSGVDAYPADLEAQGRRARRSSSDWSGRTS